MDALLDLGKIFEEIPFNKTLGLQLTQLETDRAAMSFDMKPDLIGNYLHGILHGGVISSVLDMAGGMAAMSSIIEQHRDLPLQELATIIGKSSTIDLHISYVRPGKGTRFIANAAVMHRGKKICFVKMELMNQDEVLVASGTGTYLIG